MIKKNILFYSNDIGSTHQYIGIHTLLKRKYNFIASGSKLSIKEYKKHKIKVLDIEKFDLDKNISELNLSFIFLGLSLEKNSLEKNY